MTSIGKTGGVPSFGFMKGTGANLDMKKRGGKRYALQSRRNLKSGAQYFKKGKAPDATSACE